MPIQNFGRQQAAFTHQFGDLHKRFAVFFVRWSVHDDETVRFTLGRDAIYPKVTPKTSICRCGAYRCGD